jgi:hypothetical protein
VRLSRDSLAEIIESGEPVLGFWGVPPRDALERTAARFDDLPYFDLDVFRGAPASQILPDAFCHIIRNCVDNALALGPRLSAVVAATGAEKCDSGRFAARVLRDLLDCEVIATENPGASEPTEPLLSESRGSLKHRVVRMMEAIVEPLDDAERDRASAARCEPTCGFWGTPPHPIELLDLFPETTHVFGWTRCVEQGRPADLELELAVPEGLPIVFFSQGFCNKGMLARRLAEQHRGLHVDVHDALGAATMAKIEAFIRLSSPSPNSGRAGEGPRPGGS